MSISHNKDFHAWCLDQVTFLERRELQNIDWENLIQEIQSMGASERQELENRLCVLFAHLLKWIYQKDYRSNSWKQTIKEQRRKVLRKMENFPSLKSHLTKIVDSAYEFSVLQATRETGIPEETFPTEMPFTVEQALNNEWWPE